MWRDKQRVGEDGRGARCVWTRCMVDVLMPGFVYRYSEFGKATVNDGLRILEGGGRDFVP